MRQTVLLMLTLWLITGCSASKPVAGHISADVRHGDTPLAQSENDQALDLIDRQKYVEAEQHLKRSIDADILYGPAHNNLGTIYFRQSKFYPAALEFEYAGKLMPRHAEPRNNLGLVFEASGKINDAVACYDRAIVLEPENPVFVGNSARARFRRGDQSEELRDLLGKVVAMDTRDEWVDWARKTMRNMKRPATTMP